MEDPGGEYELTCEVDPSNQVREQREDNNTKRIRIEVERLPDLVVTEVWHDPDKLSPFEDYKLVCRIENRGTREAVDATILQ